MDVRNVSTSFPLAPLHVASLLDAKGYDVTIIDQRVETKWKESLVQELLESPIFVGITAMTGNQILDGLECSKLVKAHSQNIKVIWGGVHASLLPEQTIENDYVDVVVIGEGEKVIVEIADAIVNKKGFAGIKGITYKEKGRILNNGTRDFIDLNEMPDVPYYLLSVDKYFFDLYRCEKSLSLLVGKGCVHKCGYCYNPGFNKGLCRGINPEVVVRRTKNLVEFGAHTIDLVNDNFFYDRQRVERMCNLLIEDNIKVNLTTNCRIDYVASFSLDFLRMLKRAGFIELFCGIESGSQKISNLIRKNLTLNEILEGNKKLKEVGITPIYSFMAGFPGETFEDINKTIDIAIKLLHDNPDAFLTPIKIFTPFPGTELFDICVENGFNQPSTLEEWGRFNYNTPQFKWSTAKDVRKLENISYLTYFLDNKSMLKHFGKNVLLRLLIRFYSMIVRIRCRHHFYSCCPEVKIMKSLKHRFEN